MKREEILGRGEWKIWLALNSANQISGSKRGRVCMYVSVYVCKKKKLVKKGRNRKKKKKIRN